MANERDYRDLYGEGMAPPPGPDRRTVSHGDYQLTFYPGFARRCSLVGPGDSLVLYEQEEPFVLPAGQVQPRVEHEIHLRGGPGQQDVRLVVNDPRRRIARIIVEMYAEDLPVGSSHPHDAPVEALVLENRAMLCPPMCY
jgi:hypothetical protein